MDHTAVGLVMNELNKRHYCNLLLHAWRNQMRMNRVISESDRMKSDAFWDFAMTALMEAEEDEPAVDVRENLASVMCRLGAVFTFQVTKEMYQGFPEPWVDALLEARKMAAKLLTLESDPSS